MNAWIGAVAVVGTLTGATNAWALSDYRCTVERSVSASDSNFNQMYIGKQFTVERRTGLMAGALKNSYFTKPTVIDDGSTGNAFMVVTTMRADQGVGAGSMVYVLTINEFTESASKPFIYLINSDAYLGQCEHF